MYVRTGGHSGGMAAGRVNPIALERIRDIRASEKVFYRQALEIYATSIDYDPKAEISIAFFIKMPFAAKILNEM